MDDKSQIKACESSPAVQMWHELCGAQAKAFTDAWCRCSSATGNVGNLQRHIPVMQECFIYNHPHISSGSVDHCILGDTMPAPLYQSYSAGSGEARTHGMM